MRASEKKWPRRSCSSPGPGPQRERKGKTTVDKDTISPAGDPFYAASCPDDTIEAHYASLERACNCYGGHHYIGHMVEGDDGEEVEVFEAVPCRRCSADSR